MCVRRAGLRGARRGAVGTRGASDGQREPAGAGAQLACMQHHYGETNIAVVSQRCCGVNDAGEND
jgi:hypothetical protein